MLRFWNKVLYELERYQKVFVALVVDQQKGSPGTTRSRLLVTEASEVLGTIGGGVMEARLIEEASTVLKAGKQDPVLKTTYHRKTEQNDKSGLICGGSQTILTMVLNHDHKSLVNELVDRLLQDLPGSLSITSEGMSLSDQDLNEPSVTLKRVGEDWKATIGLLNRNRVLIVGCGHCGAALARQMYTLGFHVTIVEMRESLLAAVDFQREIVKLNISYSSAGQWLEHARLTFAVVMTPSYSDDVDALASLLPEAFPYIGVMGSPVKLQKIKEELLSRGFGDTDWERITAPVGLPIESDTPEEIAVSVAAQILQERSLENVR